MITFLRNLVYIASLLSFTVPQKSDETQHHHSKSSKIESQCLHQSEWRFSQVVHANGFFLVLCLFTVSFCSFDFVQTDQEQRNIVFFYCWTFFSANCSYHFFHLANNMCFLFVFSARLDFSIIRSDEVKPFRLIIINTR